MTPSDKRCKQVRNAEKIVLTIAEHNADGFAWNPYSWSNIQTVAGRLLRQGILVKRKDVEIKKPFKLLILSPKYKGLL